MEQPALGKSQKHSALGSQQQAQHLGIGLHSDGMRSRPVVRPFSDTQDRQWARIPVTGTAQLYRSGHVAIEVRLHDMSMSGFSIFLDSQLRLLQSFKLKLLVFRHGNFHHLDVRAQCVYVTLVRLNGFKHGFEFMGLDDRAEDVIRAIHT